MPPEPAQTPDNNVPSAPSKESHMRTYASDVARLTGKPLPKTVVNVPAPAAPKPPPPEPPPAPVIPKAPMTSETGDEVLARLQKAAAVPSAPAPVAKPAPTPAFKPSASPHQRPAPTVGKPVVSIPAVAVPPPGIPPVAKSSPVSPIHTYKSDLALHTEKTGLSRIGMVAAEQDAGGASPVVFKEKKKGTALLVVAGVILVVAGIGSIYAAYRFATGDPGLPQEAYVPSLIFADERIRLAGSGEELRQALAATTGRELGDRDVAVVYMTYSTTTEAGIVEELATGKDLMTALRLPAPDLLLRNIEAPSTLGVISADGEIRPFFILKVSSFDRTYAAMLEWEATMERDLSSFYPPHFSPPPPAATTTATSTAPVPKEEPPASSFRLSFIDEVLENRDVRVLRDAENRIVMLYGYRDKDTLIIARSAEAFSELLSRLASTRMR